MHTMYRCDVYLFLSGLISSVSRAFASNLRSWVQIPARYSKHIDSVYSNRDNLQQYGQNLFIHSHADICKITFIAADSYQTFQLFSCIMCCWLLFKNNSPWAHQKHVCCQKQVHCQGHVCHQNKSSCFPNHINAS